MKIEIDVSIDHKKARIRLPDGLDFDLDSDRIERIVKHYVLQMVNWNYGVIS